MATILTEEFESWNDNSWSVVATGSATFNADATSKKNGDYGGNMYQAVGGSGIVWVRKYVGTYNPMYYETYFKIASGDINTGDTIGLIRIVDSGGTGLFGLYLRKNVDGNIYLYTMTYGILSNYEITTHIISIGTWYKVEIGYKTAVSGFYKVWLNDGIIYNETANSSANNNPYGVLFGDSYGSASAFAIRVYYDDMYVKDAHIVCNDVLLENAGGYLCCKPIDWGERQACKVAVRSIPLRTTGSFIDDGTWTLKNRRLYIIIRLTDAEKTTLQAIFDENVEVTVTTDGWTYTGWFTKKPLAYKYSVDDSGNTREWIVKMEFVLSSFSYSP